MSEFGGRLDRYLCDGAEEAMFGDGRYECQMCGKEISESMAESEENQGLCDRCICKTDDHANEFFKAPLWLIQNRMEEYCDKYEWTIKEKDI